ncbi:MAG: hypothetical protein IKO46_09615 [Salinivirgaceae bacterium]|nr:hypothetical protein [Salinivirgaceae bacterium]MBR4621229.1 hypothetical protein [Salinivirgaceae bacterium]
MKHNFLFVAMAAFAFAACGSNEQIKVACVGDSITEGHGIKIQSRDDYPVVLNRILGDGYSVQNCGKSGTTVQKDADYPYWICKEFSNAVALNADIVVIKLGTNDTKPQNWNAERFKTDYQSLIDTLKTNGRNPQIFVCTPAPAFSHGWGINDSVIVAGVIPAVAEIAQANSLTIIDLHKELADKQEYFKVDGIHPDEAGAAFMAEVIAKAIKKD